MTEWPGSVRTHRWRPRRRCTPTFRTRTPRRPPYETRSPAASCLQHGQERHECGEERGDRKRESTRKNMTLPGDRNSAFESSERYQPAPMVSGCSRLDGGRHELAMGERAAGVRLAPADRGDLGAQDNLHAGHRQQLHLLRTTGPGRHHRREDLPGIAVVGQTGHRSPGTGVLPPWTPRSRPAPTCAHPSEGSH
jgi:hypothetical protein